MAQPHQQSVLHKSNQTRIDCDGSMTQSQMSPTFPTVQVTPVERFYRYFQNELTALQAQMKGLAETTVVGGERNDAFEHTLAGIARLQREVEDASGYLPAFDLRTYSEAIKALTAKLDRLRAKHAPRPLFSFKSMRRNVGVPEVEISLSNSEDSDDDDVFAAEVQAAEQEDNAQSCPSVTLTSTKPSFVKLPYHLTAPLPSLHISNVTDCVVDLTAGNPPERVLPSVTLTSVAESIILLPRVAGPVHLTEVKNSIIAIQSCGQLRMHDSVHSNVYLNSRTGPIVERVKEIGVAPLLVEHYLSSSIPSTTVSSSPTHNRFDQVRDFSWLRPTPSPNWRILSSSRRIPGSSWISAMNAIFASPPNSSEDERSQLCTTIKQLIPLPAVWKPVPINTDEEP